MVITGFLAGAASADDVLRPDQPPPAPPSFCGDLAGGEGMQLDGPLGDAHFSVGVDLGPAYRGNLLESSKWQSGGDAVRASADLGPGPFWITAQVMAATFQPQSGFLDPNFATTPRLRAMLSSIGAKWAFSLGGRLYLTTAATVGLGQVSYYAGHSDLRADYVGTGLHGEAALVWAADAFTLHVTSTADWFTENEYDPASNYQNGDYGVGGEGAAYSLLFGASLNVDRIFRRR